MNNRPLSMFRHLCNTCEEIVRIVLIPNGRSVTVYVFTKFHSRGASTVGMTRCWRGSPKVLMIGRKYLWSAFWYYFTEEDTSKKYTLLHTHVYYLPNHQQNRVCSACPFAELAQRRSGGMPPTFWRKNRLLQEKTRFTTALLLPNDVSSLLKNSTK